MHHYARILGSLVVSLVTAVGLAITSPNSFAQGFPTKPIRIVSSTPPGSGNDLVSRAIVPAMSKALGQPIIVDNMPGGSGMVAARYVAKQSAPDGYTLLTLSGTFLVAPIFVKDAGIDFEKDLAPVSLMVESPLFFITNANAPWNTFGEMVAYAKKNPGKLNYGLPGPTDLLALYMGVIRAKFGVDIVDVPYKNGVAGYVPAILANEVQLAFVAESSYVGLETGNRVKALAVSGEARHPKYKNIPTFKEIDIPAITGVGFLTFSAANTPKAVVDKLNEAIVQALRGSDVNALLAKVGSSRVDLQACKLEYSIVSPK